MDLVNSIPFPLLFVEEIELSLHHESIKDASILENSYNPETQTSDYLIYADTSTTTTNTFSFNLNDGYTVVDT